MGKAKRKSSRSAPVILSPLLAPLGALQHLLERFDNRGVIIGGIAASLLEQQIPIANPHAWYIKWRILKFAQAWNGRT